MPEIDNEERPLEIFSLPRKELADLEQLAKQAHLSPEGLAELLLRKAIIKLRVFHNSNVDRLTVDEAKKLLRKHLFEVD